MRKLQVLVLVAFSPIFTVTVDSQTSPALALQTVGGNKKRTGACRPLRHRLDVHQTSRHCVWQDRHWDS